MPYFHIKAHDKVGAAQVRLDNREAHLGWIKTRLDQVKIAGPMINNQTGGMMGSILVIEAESRAELDALLAEDPYAKADLFDTVEISTFKWVIGAPEA